MSLEPYLILLLTVFFILIAIELLILYLRHSAGFTLFEVILLLLLPLFLYISTIPYWITTKQYGILGLVTAPRLFDVPLFQVGNSIVGINIIGFFVPVIVSSKILLQKRVPIRESVVLIGIISFITYLYTSFQPGVGIVIYFFAIPPLLSAGVSFMFRFMNPAVNPALLSYVGATVGVLIGADVLNIYKAVCYPWANQVFISIGGGGVIDAIFLAGFVSILADVLIRSQVDDIIGSFIDIFRKG
jgi:uncharacterized membrane protein